MLTTELAAGESLRIVPGENVSRAKIDLSLPDEDTFSPETLQRLRNNLGSDFIVSGSYLDSGKGGIRVDLRLQSTSKGDRVAAISATSNSGNLSELVSDFGARIRSKIGVPAVSQFETSGIEASFPSTPEAMKDYSEGLVRLRAFDALGARDLFERAIKSDPDFPLAHMALGRAFQTLGYDSRAVDESRKALDLAEKLSRQDYLQVEARYFESSRNWDKALETYRALYSFFPDNLEYGLSLARVETSAGRGKEALTTLAALENASSQNRDDPRIDLARSEAASSFGDNRLRRDAADSAASKAAREGARLLVGRARTYECRALANLGENDKAAPVCEEARRIYTEAGDRGGLARALHSMAEVPLNQDDLPAAEKLYREALALTREIGDKQGIGRELGNLALIYKYRGDFVTAQKMMEDALQNQQDAGDKNGMAIQSGNIGNVLRLQGDLRGALGFYERSLSLATEVGNRSSAAIATLNIGEMLVLKGDLPAAAKRYQQAVATHQELGEKFYYAGALHSLGEVLWLQGNVEKARSTYLDALAVQEQIGEKNGAAEARLALARLDWTDGKIAAAEAGVRTALTVFQSLKEVDDEIAARGLLAKILAQQGEMPEARDNLAAASQLAERSKNLVVSMPLALDRAYVVAAGGDLPGAEKGAREVQEQAAHYGMVRFQLEASLALAEFLAKGKSSALGRSQLKEVERAATKAGFRLIAASAARQL
jgi:tetratricopeptide (TPR) repeat protein